MKQVQVGFTLIELMIVVAIIGILAATALPTFQTFSVRSRVSEGLALASVAKAVVADSYFTNNIFVAASAGYQFGNPTQNVQTITIDDGTGIIRIIYGAPTGPMAGQTVTLTPMVNNAPLTAGASGPMSWACAVGANAALYAYVPTNCRN
jgi:type IV pilus assembly protein PilA